MSDLLSWLKNQSQFPKVYWKKRDSYEAWAGCGSLEEKKHPPQEDLDLFFGFTFFSDKTDALWKRFPKRFFFKPRILKKKIEHPFPRSSLEAKVIKRTDSPAKDEYKYIVEGLLRQIENGDLDKAIIARRTTLHLEEAIDPYEVMRALLAESFPLTLFLIQISQEETFLGATPEKLYEKTGTHMQSEALAGTKKRPEDQEEEASILENFKHDEKEKREFLIVKNYLEKTLSPLSSSFSWEKEDAVVKTPSVFHLYNKCSCTLKRDLSDEELLSTLHPTPALGGAPKEKALAFIEEKEPFARGLYGAPIGWFSKEASDVALAIRCALICGNEMHLFAGSGIVKGCCAEKEWEELNSKIGTYMRMMHE